MDNYHLDNASPQGIGAANLFEVYENLLCAMAAYGIVIGEESEHWGNRWTEGDYHEAIASALFTLATRSRSQ